MGGGKAKHTTAGEQSSLFTSFFWRSVSTAAAAMLRLTENYRLLADIKDKEVEKWKSKFEAASDIIVNLEHKLAVSQHVFCPPLLVRGYHLWGAFFTLLPFTIHFFFFSPCDSGLP